MLTKTEQTIAIYSKRGDEGKRLQRVYRQLFKPELYKAAYAEIRSNKGATTKGTSEETLDGMSEERIDNIIEKLKKEQYDWKPVRRVEIPKKDGKTRPLGLPSGDDKLLQTAIKILLEAYYEPTFSNRSHGFRKGRGCHTALLQVTRNHVGTNWFIEGDIKGCFDNINHEKLIKIVGENIEDGRILNILRKLLKAGYMEGWEKRGTYSGTPQGGVISPLLANIYLDRLDKWVEKELLPKYNRSLLAKGGRRKNPEYQKYANLRTKARQRGDIEAHKAYGKKMRNLPSRRTNDEGYRRLEYVRYADDFLLSFAGPKAEAERIKREISKFLKEELKLEMSNDKTLITHAKTDKARFLGYEIGIFQSQERKSVNGNVELKVPKEVITRAGRKYSKKQKPIHRPELENEGDIEIIWQFQAEYKGLVEYYRMAHNLHAISKVGWLAQGSLLKTLAHKHKMSVAKTATKYRAIATIDGKEYKVFEARVRREGKKDLVAMYGGVSLARNPRPANINDRKPTSYAFSRSEVIKRLESNECDMCGKKSKVGMHHIRKLADIKAGKQLWQKKMIAMNRKQLACCKECHKAIHSGRYLSEWDSWKNERESRVR